MNIEQPLFWYQGMFLQPQHFRQNDVRLEHLMASTLSLIQPYGWGLISLQLSESSLTAYQCRFEQLSLRFPDGTLIHYPGNAVSETRPLNVSDFSKNGRVLYVGVKHSIPGESDVQVYDTDTENISINARYIVHSEPEILEDSQSNAPQATVRPLSYGLRLFWEDEIDNQTAYVLLPVCRFELEGDRFRTSELYIPPCVQIGASQSLMRLLENIRDELIGRARQLEVFSPGRAARDADFVQMQNTFVLGILSRYIPLLSHFFETPQLSPRELYAVLIQLIGELSIFGDRCDMFGRSPVGQDTPINYRHEHTAAVFIRAASLIRQMLNDISIGPDLLIRLTLQENLYQATIPEKFFGNRHRYYLTVRTDSALSSLAEKLTCEGKLATPGTINDLINRAVPGVELLFMQTPPPGLPRRAAALYFRLETLCSAWEVIEQQKEIAFFLPDAPEDLQVELVVVHV